MLKIAMSDENLFRMCRKFGGNARFWRQKFLGLLPEVQRRRLYERKGFSSIFEFAKKLAGVNEEQVRRVLNLERKFEKTPVLQALLVRGEVSANKLVRVAVIATAENQEILAEQAKILSKSALETLVRDERRALAMQGEAIGGMGVGRQGGRAGISEADGSQKPLFDMGSVPGHADRYVNLAVNLDLELLRKLPAEVKSRLRQMAEKEIDIGQLLTELLDGHEQQIEVREAELAELEEKKVARSIGLSEGRVQGGVKRPSRYISVAIKKVLKQEFGRKCAIEG